MSKGFKRQHSSSVHENISWTSVKNLASQLLPSNSNSKEAKLHEGGTATIDNSRTVSPSATNFKGSIIDSQQPSNEFEDSTAK